jgi:hypothetical protein
LTLGGQAFQSASLVDLDPAGNVNWVDGLATPGFFLDCVATAPDGAIVLSGWWPSGGSLGSCSLPASVAAPFVAKLDSKGAVRWVRALGNRYNGNGPVAVSPNGDIVVAVWMASPSAASLNFGGQERNAPYASLVIASYAPDGEYRWGEVHTCSAGNCVVPGAGPAFVATYPNVIGNVSVPAPWFPQVATPLSAPSNAFLTRLH